MSIVLHCCCIQGRASDAAKSHLTKTSASNVMLLIVTAENWTNQNVFRFERRKATEGVFFFFFFQVLNF